MELTQLNQFKVIAQHENMSRAAEELFVTQPALSRSIKSLEKELGVNLFDRIGKKIKLNEQGKLVLKCVDDLQNRLTLLKADLNAHALAKGINISSEIYSITNYLLPLFRINNDSVNVKYNFCSQEDSLNLLYSDMSDMVFSTQAIESKKIECIELCRDYAGISVFKDDALTKYNHIGGDDLRGSKFVCFPSDNPITTSAKKMMEQYDVTFDYQPSAVAASLYIKNKNCVTFMSSLAQYLGGMPENRVFIPFNVKNTIFMTYYLCYKKDNRQSATIKLIADWLTGYLDKYNQMFP